jgi:hypothetical protein
MTSIHPINFCRFFKLFQSKFDDFREVPPTIKSCLRLGHWLGYFSFNKMLPDFFFIVWLIITYKKKYITKPVTWSLLSQSPTGQNECFSKVNISTLKWLLNIKTKLNAFGAVKAVVLNWIFSNSGFLLIIIFVSILLIINKNHSTWHSSIYDTSLSGSL